MKINQIVALILLIFCIVVILFYVIRRNNNIFRFSDIIKNHEEIIGCDKLTFFIFTFVPITLAVACVLLKNVTDSIVESINTSMSIFMGFQLAIAGVIRALPQKNNEYEHIKNKTLTEIILEVILSIITLILTFFCSLVNFDEYIIYTYIMSFVIYSLYFTVIFNVFVVLRRIYFLYIHR